MRKTHQILIAGAVLAILVGALFGMGEVLKLKRINNNLQTENRQLQSELQKCWDISSQLGDENMQLQKNLHFCTDYLQDSVQKIVYCENQLGQIQTKQERQQKIDFLSTIGSLLITLI